MAKATSSIYHFNRGMISRLAMARVDIKRAAFSAERMINWMPRVLGSMMLRPGLGYIGSVRSAERTKLLPFVFATDDSALVEINGGGLRVWRNDVLIARTAVSSLVTNGDFDTNLTGWTQNDEAGAVSAWDSLGCMGLTGTGTTAAIRDQAVGVAAADQGVEHALRIVIKRGPVILRVGSSLGDDDYIAETELATGHHSLAFTPTGDFHIRFLSRLLRLTLVDSCQVEATGAMVLPVVYTSDDVRRIRADQSGDVIFLACKGFQQRRIERRGARSWSIVNYYADDGPFRPENLGPITLTPSALNGNVTIAASSPLFKSTQVGGLLKIRSTGQRVTASIAAPNTFTNAIRVVGVGEARRFAMTVTGVWVATVTLQRSIGVVGNWEDVQSTTTNIDDTVDDGLDNQEIYYRIGIKLADYTSGTAVCTLTYTLGSITGIARITDFTDNQTVSAEVLQDFGGTDASDLWSEGMWSDRRGWPTAVALAEGRLWWSGKNGIWGSVSDAFDSFDPEFEGDAGPINRTVGSGPVDDVNWLLPMQRLMLGAAGAEHSIRSSAFDEPLTPTNFNVKQATTQGSAPVAAVKIDSRGVFVQRCGTRVYEMAFDTQAYDYGATDLTALVPEVGDPGIVAMAVQRQPDTRVHCVRSDGTVAVAVIDRVENVLSWQVVETDGVVEDVAVLPGTTEDSVYYVVARTLGSTGLSALSVTAGSGYTSRPTLVFSGGSGANAAATIDLVLVGATVAAAGSGYAVGNTLTLASGVAATAATATVATVDGSGGVLTVTIANAGDYTEVPANAVSTTGGAGSGCTITATWGLGHAAITSRGTSYEAAPIVTVVGGGGSGGAVTATIATSDQEGHYLEKWALESECRGRTLNKQADSFVVYDGETTVVAGGFVSSISVTPGAGYSTPPTVSFSGGGGVGAAATAYLKFNGPGFVASAGSGYSPGDILTAVGGTYTRPLRIRLLGTQPGGEINPFAYMVVDGGAYSALPSSPMSFTGGTGSGGTFTHTEDFWGVGEIVVTSPGGGYTSAPIVTLTGAPTGTSPVVATATASITVGTTSSPAGTTIIPGLGHLEGREVVVWADGVDLSPEVDGVQTTYTVSGGAVAVDTSVAEAVVGLPYQGTWVSAKLANLAAQEGGPSLSQRKKITQLALALAETHAKGLKFGSSDDNLNALPGVEGGVDVPKDQIWLGYDADLIEFPGEWSVDERLWLVANAPRPCTVLAATMAMEVHGKS